MELSHHVLFNEYLFLEIASHLDIKSAMKLRAVCSEFRRFLSPSCSLWMRFAERDFITCQRPRTDLEFSTSLEQPLLEPTSWFDYYREQWFFQTVQSPFLVSEIDCEPGTDLNRFTMNHMRRDDGSSCIVISGGTISRAFNWSVVNSEREVVDRVFVYSSPSVDVKYSLEARLQLPIPVQRHVSVAYKSHVFMFGGMPASDPTEKHSRMLVIDAVRHNIVDITDRCKGDVPTPRCDSSAAIIGKYMYVFGGSSREVEPLNDLYAFDCETYTWTRLHPSGGGGGGVSLPSRRSGHLLLSYNERYLILYGGAQWNRTEWVSPFIDVHAYDTKTNRWLLLSPNYAHMDKTSVPPEVVASAHNGTTFPWGSIFGHLLVVTGGGSVDKRRISGRVAFFDLIARRWIRLRRLRMPVVRDTFFVSPTPSRYDCFLVGGDVEGSEIIQAPSIEFDHLRMLHTHQIQRN